MVLKSEKKKKKKKKPVSSFSNYYSFHFFFHFQFLASLFPVGQQKFPGQKSLGALCPPRLLRYCFWEDETICKGGTNKTYLVNNVWLKNMLFSQILRMKSNKCLNDLDLKNGNSDKET